MTDDLTDPEQEDTSDLEQEDTSFPCESAEAPVYCDRCLATGLTLPDGWKKGDPLTYGMLLGRPACTACGGTGKLAVQFTKSEAHALIRDMVERLEAAPFLSEADRDWLVQARELIKVAPEAPK